MEEKLVIILNEMAEYLSVPQMKKLQEVLLENLSDTSAKKENIECVYNTELKSIAAKPDSDKLIATTTDGKEIECDGIFVAIGHEANTDYLSETIKRDELGRIIPESLPKGMFVAGDVRSNIKMQIATAVGTGCSAAMDAISYLNSKE